MKFLEGLQIFKNRNNDKIINNMYNCLKEDYINQGKKSKKEEEDKIKKVALLNKNSEKIASSKNPNESKEQLYERLHYEKLKNVKQNYERPREEKKMSKKQVNSLFDKLYKERISLKENKEKKEKEKI